MGAVYLTEDTRLHRKVALKVLPAEMASSAERLERFRREATAVAALNHPNIVTIHSVEQEGDTHFLIMELVEGDSLDRTLPSGGLPLAKVFDIGIALAEALAAAHEKGVIHRDLKPANVIVTKDGRVKVLDFGLAKLTLEGSEEGPSAIAPGVSDAPTKVAAPEGSLTHPGLVVGTVPYMSPEQVNGQIVDGRTDIFSLGVVLYELATGRRPFGGSTPAQTISSILRDAPRPVTEARHDAPRHLGRIIDHCLQKDPEARFQTAKDVRNELRALRGEVESGISAAASHPQVGPVSGSASGRAPLSAASGPMAATAGSRPWIWAGAGAALVMAIVAAFWLGGRREGEPGPGNLPAAGPGSGSKVAEASAAETNSLAVLPFADMSPDKDQEYFSDGLTEELLNALVKIPDLKVAGRTSSFSFKGKNEDLRTIGEKLGVTNILEGSVRKSGNKVRITAQLVKAADGFHLWSETYDRTLDDIFAVQDDIAKAVAQALQVNLLGRRQDAKRPDAAVYDLVLQARYVMSAGTTETNRRAREMLERAVTLAPDYAPGWAEIGLAHIREKESTKTMEEAQQAIQRAREALTRALELDPELAVAHSRMGNLHQSLWDFPAAARSTERALAADPKNPIVLGNAGLLYATMGRLEESIALVEQVHGVDPLNAVSSSNLAGLYLRAGRLDQAEALFVKVTALRPDSPAGYWGVGYIHLLRGRPEAARTALKKSSDLAGDGDYGRLGYESMVEHTAGNAEASKRATEEFEERFGAENPFVAAGLRAWRGEADAAFTWLDRALAARHPLVTELNLDPALTRLHTDPRWNALRKKIGLPTL